MTRQTFGCSGCATSWQSTAEAHCTECHAHFANETAFADHQRRPPSSRQDWRCATFPELADLGYVLDAGTWITEAGYERRIKDRAHLASLRT